MVQLVAGVTLASDQVIEWVLPPTWTAGAPSLPLAPS